MKLKALIPIFSITFLTGCGGSAIDTGALTSTMQLISKVEQIEPPSDGGCVEKTYDYTYDTSGNLIGEVRKIYDGSCVLNQVYIDTFDALGNKVKYQTGGGDGVINSTYTYAFNIHNHRINKTYDEDNDGVVERTKTYINAYDSSNRRLSTSEDYESDNTVDFITKWTYSGGDTNYATKSIDSNADGNINNHYNYTYTYDSNNNMLTKHRIYVDGGTSSTYTWTYDEDNNIATESYDSDGDGSVDRVYSGYIRAIKDAKGDYAVAVSKDNNGDGIIDRLFIVTTRDENNNVTEARFEESGVLDLTLKIYWSEYTVN